MKFSLLIILLLFFLTACSPLTVSYKLISDQLMQDNMLCLNDNCSKRLTLVPKSLHYPGGNLGLELWFYVVNDTGDDLTFLINNIKITSKQFSYVVTEQERSSNPYVNGDYDRFIISANDSDKFYLSLQETSFDGNYRKFKNHLPNEELEVTIKSGEHGSEEEISLIYKPVLED